MIGQAPSTLAVWRALAEAEDLQVQRISRTVTAFRARWRGLLAARPEGSPWLRVAGRELTGVTVIDLDTPVVHTAIEKENARARCEGGVGNL